MTTFSTTNSVHLFEDEFQTLAQEFPLLTGTLDEDATAIGIGHAESLQDGRVSFYALGTFPGEEGFQIAYLGSITPRGSRFMHAADDGRQPHPGLKAIQDRIRERPDPLAGKRFCHLYHRVTVVMDFLSACVSSLHADVA